MTGASECKQRAIELLRRGVEMARDQHRPKWIFDLFDVAIEALKQDDYELLTHALLALGSEWKERERLLENIRYRQLKRELREQRRHAGQQKLDKTMADPVAVLARVEELQSQKMQAKAI